MALKKINYNGSSKVILRLCEMVNQLIDGGGGGGSTVTYTQTLQSGTKTGEISIDGVSTDMYAPTPPVKVSDLTNDSGFITNTVNNLTNYYLKSETYTQAEVDALISAIVTLNILVVQTLPTQDISTTTIYLVPKQTAETQDIYDEYIYVNNAWEHIGTTQIDLSNYYTKSEINTLLADKVDKVAGKQLSTEDFTSTLKTKLDGIASGAEVNVQSDWSQSDNTADDYIKNKPSIPTALSDLTEDTTHRVVTDTEKSTWNGKSDFSGSYNDLTDKPTIPTVNNGTLTIKQNGTTVGTFSANQSGNTEVDITGGGGTTYTEGDGIDISAQNVISVDTVFSEASTRTNIASGDTFATILGKIKKFFTDLKAVAFSGSYNDLNDKPTIPDISTKVSKSGDTMTGNLNLEKNGEVYVGPTNTSTQCKVVIDSAESGAHGVLSSGYYDTSYHSNWKWLIYRATNGDIYLGGDVRVPNTSGTLARTSDIPTDFVSKTNGGTFNGNITISKSGNSELLLGNSGDGVGVLRIYSDTQYRAVLTAPGLTAGRAFNFPDKGGTLALTSDNCASAFTLLSGEIGNIQYASNDSHIMLICTITLGDYYEYLSLLITSSFWGNQHGSADIINIQASRGSSSSETPFTIYRVSLGGYGGNGSDRVFYYGSSGNTVYLYVYVTGGNSYGGWNISCLKQRNCSYVVNGTTNVSPSSITPISLGGRINYAERANSDDEGNRIVISYGASLGYSSGTLFLYNKSGIKISQVTISTSSRKFKRNIEPLSEAEAKKILDIETVTFDYTEEKDNYTSRKGYKNIGCIAEDVNDIIPELVTEDENGDIYGINYIEIIPYLIKMLQIQQAEINDLKAEISALKK